MINGRIAVRMAAQWLCELYKTAQRIFCSIFDLLASFRMIFWHLRGSLTTLYVGRLISIPLVRWWSFWASGVIPFSRVLCLFCWFGSSTTCWQANTHNRIRNLAYLSRLHAIKNTRNTSHVTKSFLRSDFSSSHPADFRQPHHRLFKVDHGNKTCHDHQLGYDHKQQIISKELLHCFYPLSRYCDSRIIVKYHTSYLGYVRAKKARKWLVHPSPFRFSRKWRSMVSFWPRCVPLVSTNERTNCTAYMEL